ncbi:MAG: hypothetical protein J0H36_07200, partial [Hyphomicrobium denitrificans]|nr:hypothetical protein [Hyphomicrobium denitrificans]
SIGGAVTGQNLAAPLNDFPPIFERQRVFIDVARGAGRKEICFRSEGMFARRFVHVPPITEGGLGHPEVPDLMGFDGAAGGD